MKSSTAIYAITPGSIQDDIIDMMKMMAIEYEFCMYGSEGSLTPALKMVPFSAEEMHGILDILHTWGVKVCFFHRKDNWVDLINTETLEFKRRGEMIITEKKPKMAFMYEMLSKVYLTCEEK